MKKRLGLILAGILIMQSTLTTSIAALPIQPEMNLQEYSAVDNEAGESGNDVDVDAEIWEIEKVSEDVYMNFSEQTVDFTVAESSIMDFFQDSKITSVIPPSAGPLPFLETEESENAEFRAAGEKLVPQAEIGRTSQVSVTNGLHSLYRLSVNGGNVMLRARQQDFDGKELGIGIVRSQYNSSNGQTSVKDTNVTSRIFENGEILLSITGLVNGTVPAGTTEYFDIIFFLPDSGGKLNPGAGVQMFRDGDSLYFRQSVIMQANRSAIAAVADSFEPSTRLSLPANPDYAPIFQLTDQLVTGKSSDFDKIKAIHDWVASNIAYDFVNLNNDDEQKYMPVDTFNNRYGVCSGISRLFMIMARYAGVPTVTIAGLSNSNWTGLPYYLESTVDLADHEWNAVYLDGIWQYIDPTWNCRNEYKLVNGQPAWVKGDIDYTYFLPDEYSFHLNHRADMVYIGDSSDYQTIRYPAVNKTYINTKAPVKVSNLAMVPDISALRIAQPVRQFDVNVYPVNAFEKEVTWSIENNTAGASISWDGQLTVANAGHVTVVATARDGSGIQAKRDLTVLNPDRKQIEAFVTRMYSNIMGRAPDASGLKFWTDGLMTGEQTGTSISGFFLKDADELKQKNLSNEKYVEIVYITAFGRMPDPGGQAYWTDLLNQGGTREGIVAKMLVAGDEFANICFNAGLERGAVLPIPNRDQNPQLTAFVVRMYTEILGRAYENDGLDYWTGFMLNSPLPMKERIAQLANSFVFSKEFIDGNHSNTEFVRRMYLTFMNRIPDAGGQSHWTGVLDRGEGSRQDVFNSFLNSPEFANIARSYGLM